jgi:hypothetical protein
MSEAERRDPGTGVEGADQTDERRADARHFACFPTTVETGQGSPRTALIRDLSVSGALLLTQIPLPVGQAVTLALYLDGETPRVVTGQVVRDERRHLKVSHPWTHSVGVKFDDPLEDLDTEIKDLAARQAKLLGKAI